MMALVAVLRTAAQPSPAQSSAKSLHVKVAGLRQTSPQGETQTLYYKTGDDDSVEFYTGFEVKTEQRLVDPQPQP